MTQCEYCASPRGRQHKGFCLTVIDGERERWQENDAAEQEIADEMNRNPHA
ncbi:hypothetical protein BARRETLEMON_44 [Arthrobacter phage BarretLemon]|uniref:Uncharacterized protein n=1 Tax=Arthrobacter phage BarretLemon TaxID=1796994 RepID=A0A140G771_9CAUD|nr:hypothetical protein BJD79_gp44 [Arthrobacter phage BarretLemon]AMM44506.1 hypothetical protein BARRETLEMON_44 [Arthrobacter phage BarretLemon]